MVRWVALLGAWLDWMAMGGLAKDDSFRWLDKWVGWLDGFVSCSPPLQVDTNPLALLSADRDSLLPSSPAQGVILAPSPPFDCT
ncbi:hypothetical protein E2C01_052141 [Portunus trituberculatus]|uniref:Secreted protein n=1 Tax=Portunus trituberculatus TaxID=210409 RepID=A0A5B7GKR7_PORTR|nr:hypothetical protein [Portunus trituberculatus]